MTKERAAFTPDQGQRIADSVRWTEKFKHQKRPQPIKPRFSGGGGPGVVRFQLVGDLTLGSHAEASLLKLSSPGGSWVVDEDKDNIEVYDFFLRNVDEPDIDSPGMWAGKIGFQGWATKRTGSTPLLDEGEEGSEDDETRKKYDIIWMEQLAAWIEFRATEDFGETESTGIKCEVISFDHQGISPAELLSGEEELMVYDPFSAWTDIVDGSNGHALYDYSQEKYHIVYADRLCVFAKAILDEEMCRTASTISVTSFQPIAHGDFNRLESWGVPSIVFNEFQHAGQEYDEILLMRKGFSGPPLEVHWVIVDVDKHDLELVTDFRIGTGEDDGLYFQKKVRTIAAEYCEPEEPIEWEDVIEVRTCTGAEE